MDDDWGLQAVVRGCSATTTTAASTANIGSSSATTITNTTTTTTTTTSFMTHHDFQPNNNNNSFFFFSSPFGSTTNNNQQSSCGQLFALPDPMRPRNHVAVEELHELYKPFFPKSQITSSPKILSVSSLNSSSNNDQRLVRQTKQNVLNQPAKQSHGGSTTSTTTPRSKKRKNQLKKVCQVPAESLSSDIWAWRKYGQKPIKGSPYPRGYYRCSSSKGCLARKQVERNRSDPGMFIVTYTAEHNHPAPTHRNSLAGSTRQKPTSAAVAAAVGDAGNSPSAVKPSSPATSVEEEVAAAQAQSITTESKEGQESSTVMMDDEEEDEFGFFDDAVSDDFFVGLEGLGAPAIGDFFSDHFPSSFGLPWVASNAATAAGGS